MIRTPLAILSVLKPVDDVRMYEKLGRSLAGRGYGVNIIGFQSQANLRDPSVRFHPVFCFRRLSEKRLTANYTAYRTLKKIKPKIVVLTTPELFPAVWWYQRRFGTKLIYDLVENYRRNLRYNRGFSRWLRAPLAKLVAWLEGRLVNRADLLLLAEKGYRRELSFPENIPVQVIENKAIEPSCFAKKPKIKTPPLSLVYTGTVSEVYGIYQTLELIKSLVEAEHLDLQLTVLGHVPQPFVHRYLRRFASRYAWLRLQTGDQPVPHSDIVELIGQADFGIVSHQPVPSIANCFPTRIWEYMAYRLPFLLQAHPYWTEYCTPWQCAIPLDFNQPNTAEVRRQLLETEFYPRGVPKDIYWEGEEVKLIKSFQRAGLR